MLLRILGEVMIGLTAAGLVMAIAVPAVASLGHEPQPWLAWAAVTFSIAVSVTIGERMNKRRKARQSP